MCNVIYPAKTCEPDQLPELMIYGRGLMIYITLHKIRHDLKNLNIKFVSIQQPAAIIPCYNHAVKYIRHVTSFGVVFLKVDFIANLSKALSSSGAFLKGEIQVYG